MRVGGHVGGLATPSWNFPELTCHLLRVINSSGGFSSLVEEFSPPYKLLPPAEEYLTAWRRSRLSKIFFSFILLFRLWFCPHQVKLIDSFAKKKAFWFDSISSALCAFGFTVLCVYIDVSFKNMILSFLNSVSMASICLSSVLTGANMAMYQTGIADILQPPTCGNNLHVGNGDYSSIMSGKKHNEAETISLWFKITIWLCGQSFLTEGCGKGKI